MSCYTIKGRVLFDTAHYGLTRDDGVQVRLGKMEASVLSILCEHANKTVTRKFIFDNAWPNDTGNDGHLNRVVVLLRRKLDSLGCYDVIKTVPKVGYMMVEIDVFCNDMAPLSHITTDVENSHISLSALNDASKIDCSPLTSVEQSEPSKELILLPEVKAGYTKHILYPLLLLLASGFFIALFNFSYLNSSKSTVRESQEAATYNASSKFMPYAFYHDDKIALYSSLIFDEKTKLAISEMAKSSLRDALGLYYIGISYKTISVLQMTSKHLPLNRYIFLRGEQDLKDQLSCILSALKSHVEMPPTRSTHYERGAVTRYVTAFVSPTCPIDIESSIQIKASTTVSTNAAEHVNIEHNRFFYISIGGASYDGVALFDISIAGYVDNILVDGIAYERWSTRTKTLNHVSQDIHRNLVMVKFIDGIVNRETPFIVRRIADGVYFSDFLGGIMIATN